MAIRVKSGFNIIEFGYKIILTMPKKNGLDTVDKVNWIDNNCCGRYYVGQIRPSRRFVTMTFYFEDEEDALAFKLRWS